MTKKIAVLVGSGSTTSISQLVANHLKNIAPASIQLNFVNIADLPLYDRDLDENSPAEYVRFRQEIAQADGFLFVTPEHNGGMSAMMKNAIDVGSRPMGQSLWPNKPAGIVSVAAGMSGGVFNGVLNEQGEIVSESVVGMLQGFINSYADFIAKF